MPTSIPLKQSPAPSQGQLPLPSSQERRSSSWLKTAAIAAFSIFAVVNTALFVANPDQKLKGSANDSVKDLWSGAGSIDLAVNGFAALKERPTVVLLGSSLIMHPFWAMDAELNPKIQDIFHYHASKTFEHKLADEGAAGQRVYNFAIFGEMVSDAYIYVNEFLKGDKKPDVLVFGIAPRDFSDSDLPAPMATFTFKKLVGLDNFAKYAEFYLPGWQDKADWIASHACFFYGKRWRLQHEVERVASKGYNFFGIANQDKAEVEGGQNNTDAGFMLSGSSEQRWSNSAREYKRRYRDIDTKDLSLQEGFLNKLLTVCENRGIKVVLVNMPLSKENRALLPDQFYTRFREKIASIAQRPGVKLVDLGMADGYTSDDYWDTAHLNHIGGHKLIATVAPFVVQELAGNARITNAKPANAQPASTPHANAQPANAQPANAQPANAKPENAQPANSPSMRAEPVQVKPVSI